MSVLIGDRADGVGAGNGSVNTILSFQVDDMLPLKAGGFGESTFPSGVGDGGSPNGRIGMGGGVSHPLWGWVLDAVDGEGASHPAAGCLCLL